MKKEKFNTKTAKELEKLLQEKREALRAFNFGTTGSKTTNVKAARSFRKDIARILTSLPTAR